MENEKFQEFVVKHLMNISNDMSSLKKTVTRIETRMETEIVDKIKVLFDSHRLHEDRIDRIEKKIGINM